MTHSFQRHHLTSDKRSQEVHRGQSPPNCFLYIQDQKHPFGDQPCWGRTKAWADFVRQWHVLCVVRVCFTMVSLIFCVIKCLPMIIFLCVASPLIAVVPQQSCQKFLGHLREWDSLRCCWFVTDTWLVRLTFEDGSFWHFTIRLEFLDNHSRHTIYLLSPSRKSNTFFSKRPAELLGVRT